MLTRLIAGAILLFVFAVSLADYLDARTEVQDGVRIGTRRIAARRLWRLVAVVWVVVFWLVMEVIYGS